MSPSSGLQDGRYSGNQLIADISVFIKVDAVDCPRNGDDETIFAVLVNKYQAAAND